MSLMKFIPGVIGLQVMTVLLTVVVLDSKSPPEALWLPVGLVCGLLALLAAVWFGSIADQLKKDAVLAASVSHFNERERLLVNAEKDKQALLEQSYQQILKESARLQSRAHWRLSLGITGLLMLGGMMLAIEFMTLGLLVIATAGGVIAGYVVRSRQETRLIGQSRSPVSVSSVRTLRITTPDSQTRR